MASERLLIDYLPPFLREFREMRFIMAAIQPEIDTLYEAMHNALNDQYIQYATESGIKRYEKMLKITPKDTETLEERRFRLLTIMGKEMPYTLIKLHEMLTGICGEGNYSIDLQPHNYHIMVKLALSNENNYQQVVDMLSNTLPANLTQTVQVQYNYHDILKQFTHEELTAYTHNQLRKEVFLNG